MIVLFDKKRAAPKAAAPLAAEERAQESWHKVEAIADVAEGRLTADEACRRYGLSADALATWQRALQAFGLDVRRRKTPDESD
ncbi:DUF1153 domain-containing protein [Enterovirga sp. GCM10030262]|uniref:DUF1153 domain-containing protein n=1 Tax=Enterovirga sp. GCM10030262 TaxID=3273391 RepID=UPI0036187E60